MPLARCYLVILIRCLNIMVSWLDLLHVMSFQYVTAGFTPAQTIRRDAKIPWMRANQKGSHGPSQWTLTRSGMDSAPTVQTGKGAAQLQRELGLVHFNRSFH